MISIVTEFKKNKIKNSESNKICCERMRQTIQKMNMESGEAFYKADGLKILFACNPHRH